MMRSFKDTSAAGERTTDYPEIPTISSDRLYGKRLTILSAELKQRRSDGADFVLFSLISDNLDFLEKFLPDGRPVYQSLNFFCWSQYVIERVRSHPDAFPCSDVTLVHVGKQGYDLAPWAGEMAEEGNPF